MDLAYRLVKRGLVHEGIERLIWELSFRRRQTPGTAWTQFIREVVRPHPLFSLCLEDPYTNRAFHKPRGFAGDAVMLDLGDPGTVVTLATPIDQVPPYVGPAAPVAGAPPDWGAAAAEEPD